ncbi:hypothetical protein PCE1_003549 [Barthelona sp. PCE]
MSKTPINVLIRLRPTSEFDTERIQVTDNEISIHIPRDPEAGIVNNQQDLWKYKFTNILKEANQDQVYTLAAKSIIAKAIKGYNGAILAYGQTGAGKTYTVSGGADATFNTRGIAARAVSDLFNEIERRSDLNVTVRVSYIEIYQNQIKDLLCNLPADPLGNPISSGEGLQIVTGPNGEAEIMGLTKPVAENESQALSYIFEGESHRRVSGHSLNSTSSRSHCIISIYLQVQNRLESQSQVLTSKVHFVDLAGSERVKKTGSVGQLLKEAQYINKSLSLLEQVILQARNPNAFVPFRSSKLTNILRDSVGGNAFTTLIACVYPIRETLEESLATLRFASRLGDIYSQPKVNVKEDLEALVHEQKAEIGQLKQELAMYDLLNNRDPKSRFVDSLEVRNSVLGFLNGTTDIDIKSIGQIRQVLELMRLMGSTVKQYLTKASGVQVSYEDMINGHFPVLSGKPEAVAAAVEAENVARTGEVDEGVGEAIGSTAVVGSVQSNMRPDETLFEMHKAPVEPVAAPVEKDSHTPVETVSASRNREDLYQMYLDGDGSVLNSQLEAQKSEMDELKAEMVAKVAEVNDTKAHIDELRLKLQAIGNKDTNVIDVDEYTLRADLTKEKDAYKAQYRDLDSLKQQKAFLSQQINMVRYRIFQGFSLFETTFKGEVAMAAKTDDVGEVFDTLELANLAPEEVPFFKARKLQTQADNLRKTRKFNLSQRR